MNITNLLKEYICHKADLPESFYLADGEPKGEIVEEMRRLGMEVTAKVVCHFAIFAKTSFEPTLL